MRWGRTSRWGTSCSVCIAVVAALAACGDGPSEGCQEVVAADSSGASWADPSEIVLNVTADNFCEELAKAGCAAIHKCCSPPPPEEADDGLLLYLQSEAECRRWYEVDCGLVFAELLAGVERGTVELDAKAAAACLHEILPVDTPCVAQSVVDEWLPSCANSFFHGVQPAGLECVSHLECAAGLSCGPALTCVPLPGDGEECREAYGAFGCAVGLMCGDDVRCHVPGKTGDQCGLSLPCTPDLYCAEQVGGGPALCAPTKGAGEECSSAEECTQGLCPGVCVPMDPGDELCWAAVGISMIDWLVRW